MWKLCWRSMSDDSYLVWSVRGASSDDTADPRILSLASAYSFSRCSNVFIWGFVFCAMEDKAGEESGRLRIVTDGFGRWRILGRKSSPPFDRIENPFWFAVAISFLILSCFSCSSRFSSCENLIKIKVSSMRWVNLYKLFKTTANALSSSLHTHPPR